MRSDDRARHAARGTRTGLTRRLKRIILISAGLALGLSSIGYAIYDIWMLRIETVERLEAQARIVGGNCTAALSFGDVRSAEDVLRSLHRSAITAARIFDENGKPFATWTNTSGAGDSLPASPSRGAHFNLEALEIFQPIAFNRGTIGCIYLRANLDPVYRRIAMQGGMMLLVLAISAVFTYAVSSHLQRAITEPILRLAGTAQRVSASEDYSVRGERTTDDEIGQLVDGFNEMLGRIEKRDAALQASQAALHDTVEQLRVEVAERQRAEEGIRVFAARLEQSNRELQDFASIASHDLQEPLRKVQAFADRLQHSLGDGLDARDRDSFDRMLNATVRMQTLINDLLTYSRVTTKAQPFVPVDLATVVADVLSDLEIRIEQSGGTVESGALPVVEADALQMRQLFQNVIGNALKYHRAGVPPLVRLTSTLFDRKNGDASPRPGTPMVRIDVRDNGIGFDEKYREQIFTIFQRLHGRSEYEGTGVGLAVCRKIVERHGGCIEASSVPGEGSTFSIVLPAHRNGTA